MANNRMYFMHEPTGIAIYMAKTMADGWYDVPDTTANQMRELFSIVEDLGYGKDEFGQFKIAYELDYKVEIHPDYTNFLYLEKENT